MEKNIVLIGMMGCGKSTIGALLAQRLGRELVDTDALIEEREGRSIAAIFAEAGEEYFRTLEQAVSEELAARRGLIIACGGGLPLREGAMAPLKASGRVVWLRRDPAQTYASMDTAGRPLAQQGRAAFLERFAQREPVYRRWADLIVEDFSSPEATLHAVLEEST